MAGLPQRPSQHLDGRSLMPLLKGRTLGERPLFWHYPHYSNQGGGPCGTIRVGDLKLIEWYEDMRVELFNLKNDLEEKRDLSKTLPEQARALQQQLHDWRASLHAAMPTPNPDWVPSAAKR